MVVKHPGEADLKNIRSHLHKFLYTGLKVHTDLRDRLSESKSLDVIKTIAQEMQARRAALTPSEKIGWYYRYWPSMGVTPGVAPTFNLQDWDTKISMDPLFNKKLKDKATKKEEIIVSNHVLESGEISMDLGGFLDGKHEADEEQCQCAEQ